MQIEKTSFMASAKKVGISASSAEEFWKLLEQKKESTRGKLELATLLYYFGALIVVLAMSWLIFDFAAIWGGPALFFLALLYIIIFAVFGKFFWNKAAFKVLGGLLITVAVALLPVAIYGLAMWLGYPASLAVRMIMQAGLVIGGVIALRWIRFPFLTLPIFIGLWLFLMNLVPLIWGQRNDTFIHREWVSAGFGLALLIWAYLTDLESKRSFAFWGYLWGMVAFWGGASLLFADEQIAQWLYLLLNIILIFLSVLLQRVLLLVYGALGILLYLIQLFYHSPWFPLILSIIGIGVILLGIVYHKKRASLQRMLSHYIPTKVKRWLPRR